MKFAIAAVFLIFAISQVLSLDEGLEQKKVLEKWKAFQTKMDKLDPNDFESLVFMNHLVQYNKNYENVTRAQTHRGERVYLGCFKDHRKQRMFRGYSEKGANNVHIDGCIEKCRNYKFAYAGAQSGNECFCGNSAPQTSLNAKLGESSCDKKCSSVAHKHEMCGGSWASSVYSTGYVVTRQDENGNVIGESNMYSAKAWSRD